MTVNDSCNPSFRQLDISYRITSYYTMGTRLEGSVSLSLVRMSSFFIEFFFFYSRPPEIGPPASGCPGRRVNILEARTFALSRRFARAMTRLEGGTNAPIGRRKTHRSRAWEIRSRDRVRTAMS